MNSYIFRFVGVVVTPGTIFAYNVSRSIANRIDRMSPAEIKELTSEVINNAKPVVGSLYLLLETKSDVDQQSLQRALKKLILYCMDVQDIQKSDVSIEFEEAKKQTICSSKYFQDQSIHP